MQLLLVIVIADVTGLVEKLETARTVERARVDLVRYDVLGRLIYSVQTC